VLADYPAGDNTTAAMRGALFFFAKDLLSLWIDQVDTPAGNALDLDERIILDQSIRDPALHPYSLSWASEENGGHQSH
jgi:hypothetical protein